MARFILTVLLLIGSSAHAGNDGGGGGGFLVDGKVLLLDLVEATKPKNGGGITEKGLNIIESNDSVESQVERALNKLSYWYQPRFPNLATEVRRYYAIAVKNMRPIAPGYTLAFPDDANLKFIPDSYKPIGIALWETDYSDQDTVWFDSKMFNLMSNTHKAALLIHEAVYKFLRIHVGDKDSRRARAITGYLFSDMKPYKLDPETEVTVSVQSLEIEICNLAVDIIGAKDSVRVLIDPKSPIAYAKLKAKNFFSSKKESWGIAAGRDCDFRVLVTSDEMFFSDARLMWGSKPVKWNDSKSFSLIHIKDFWDKAFLRIPILL